ncbi:head completion/stabilization protein [Novosphingobium rosa]|uniref:head completion/stabilization protein n=1 Tax=Novosphingobium rosa TaxID=76978 RepID=UPI00082BC443|nr:head completion/stabilization protein [Novosphingobium rosa]
MSGSPLITMPQSPASPPNSVVPGDGWWPDIDCTATRDALRIGEFVTHPRLVNALQGAVLDVTSDLTQWCADLMEAGAETLATVTAAQLLTLRVRDNRPRYLAHCLPTTRPRYKPARAAWLAKTINDQPRLIDLYTRAVRYAAAGQLADEYRDLATTAAGQPRVDVMECVGDDYRRTSIGAVRDMLGVTRVTVELI